MKYKIRQRIFALFLAFTLVLNSVGSLFQVAYATDEIIPTPEVSQEVTPTQTPTETPTVSPTETPIDTITPTPTQEVSPTDVPTDTPTPSDTPVDTITPTPSDVPTETITPTDTVVPTPTDVQQPQNNGPPSTDDNITPSETPATTATPTDVPESSTGNEQISAIILKNISAPSINLDTVEESNSAVLTTDKLDYAPTDTAVITGTKLLPNTAYTLTVSSSDNPATSKTENITSDESGIFAYAYQLDGKYRPNYTVELRDSTGAIVATTSFTDADPSAFDLIVLPDTQNYTDSDTAAQTYLGQTQWILTNEDALSIAYVAHEGDVVNTPSATTYSRAKTAMDVVKNSGIPFGMLRGNHDSDSTMFNNYFGISYTSSTGHYGSNNDNNYSLITAGGRDYVVVNLSYAPSSDVLTWANGIISGNSGRKAIVVSHSILNSSGAFTAEGTTIFNALKGNSNLMLMLCGHMHDGDGEAMKEDTGTNGNKIYTLLADYQDRGNGLLRIMEFTSNNQVNVKTYAVTTQTYETDDDSQFTLDFSGSTPTVTPTSTPTPTPSSSCQTVNLVASADTYLSANDVTYNNGGNTALHVDGTTDTNRRTTLLKWDLSSIPSDATVSSASLSLYVEDASPLAFNLYSMRRAWVEGTGNRAASTTSSNWNTYDGTNSWGTVGAANTGSDRYDTNLWGATTSSFSTTGSKTEALNVDGVGVVQGWISGSTNNGLIIQNYSGSTNNAAFFTSREGSTTANRPTLNISYCGSGVTPTPTATPTPIPSGTPTCVTSRISASADDVEERTNNGAVDLDGDTSTHSLQTYRTYGSESSGTLNWWGLRFLNVNVPQGATITSSSVTFRANATSGSTASSMTLWGQLATNPSTFTTGTSNITNRTRTTATTAWSVSQWTNGSDYVTPSLAAIVQEIVSQSGWVANNAMSIIGQTTVAQNRSAASYDGTNGSTLAPILEVCYTQNPATTPTVTPTSTPTPTPTATPTPIFNWAAYNDSVSPYPSPVGNITTFGISGTTTGLLKKNIDGSSTGITATFTKNGTLQTTTNGVTSDSGTDAYNTFNGIVNTAGVINGTASGWWVDLTFTNLDPAKTYTFATTNVRDGGYSDRNGQYTISDQTGAINASTTGVTIVNNESVWFNGGTNKAQGYVVRWVDINPGSDGDFTVRAQAQGTNVNGYGQSVFMLAEEVTPTATPTPTETPTPTATPTPTPTNPTLKLVKTVSGGTSVAHDWTLSAQSNGSGGFSDWGDSTTFHDIAANISYALSEQGGPSGYAPSNWTCDNGITPVNSAITVSYGKNVTCAIVNTLTDTTAPTVTSVSSDGHTYNLASTNPTITVTFSEDIANVPAIGVHSVVSDQSVTDCADGNSKTFCFVYGLSSEQATTHTIYISGAQDAAGNTMGQDNNHTFVVDTIAPTATVVYDVTTPTNGNVIATITPSETVAIGIWPTSHTFTDNGSYIFEFYDVAGNPGSATATVTNIDNILPVIDSHADVNAGNDAGQNGATVNYTLPSATDNGNISIVPTCLPTSGSFFAIGETTIICNATDAVGNNAIPTTFKVKVSDTEKPVIHLTGANPQNIEVGNAYVELGATVSDNVSGTITPSINSSSVLTSVVGTYAVTYDAVDAAGNSAIQVSRTVNVNDHPAPVITSETTTNPSQTSITITWTTDHPATSRVVYDVISHNPTEAGPNYGYANSTDEDATKTINHSVIVSPLASGTIYYFRAVSHGSPETVSDEITGTTMTQNAITICHATSSDSNPYNQISPNIQNNGDLQGGHLNHTGGIYPTVNWGDIIPPYDYGVSGHYSGMNWTTAGQAIWNNGCNIPPATATLTVIKHVINNDGGNKNASDFNITVTGQSPSPTHFTGNESGTTVTVKPGSYSIDEGTHNGYTRTLSSGCSGTISAGQTATCTITNDDIAPKLKLVKIVSGGTNTPHDWILTAQGLASGFTDFGDSTTSHNVRANVVHTLSELGPSGYTASAWRCNTGIQLADSLITLSLADDITCWITNSKNMGTLKVQKTVDDNSDLSRWSFALDAGTPVVANNQGLVDFGQVATDITHTITEIGPLGYTLHSVTGDDCTKTGSATGSATVEKNETTTCTFGNKVNKGSITVIKDAIPNDGQDFAFTFAVTGLGTNFSLDDDGNNIPLSNTKVINNLLPRTYTITENSNPDWILTSLSCKSNNQSVGIIDGNKVTLNLNPGENIICTFENAKLGKIEAKKFEDKNGNGHRDLGENNLSGWEMKLYSGSGCVGPSIENAYTNLNGIATFNHLVPGNYSVKETPKPGWEQTSGSVCQNVTTVTGCTRNAEFGNYNFGSISGHKYNDQNGNGNKDLNEQLLPGWTIQLCSNSSCSTGHVLQTDVTDSDGYYSFTDLEAGSYYVREVLQSGWQQKTPHSGYYHIIINSGSDLINKDFGNQELGSIRVCKVILDSEGQVTNGSQVSSSNFTINWEQNIIGTTQFTSGYTPNTKIFSGSEGNDSYCVTYSNLPLANYHYSAEVLSDGWETPKYNDQYDSVINSLNDFYTYGQNENSNGYMDLRLVNPGKDRTLVILNQYKNGLISGYKWNDMNSNHDKDENEPTLADWTINLYQNDNGAPGNLITTTTTDQNGEYSFTQTPGNYWVCEVQKPGWEQTWPQEQGCWNVVLQSNGNQSGLRFGNHNLTPTLTIAKANNAIGNKSPGDSVIYTIKVTVNDANANNVKVTDLLPKGFVYKSGSWKVDLNGNPLSVPEPTYASPGTWSLGNAQIGDVFTLTYTANIDGGEEPGLYKDVAWAEGQAVSDSSSEILALALPEGYVDTNFVGTQVQIAKGGQGGPEYKAATTQEVLGASTSELPSTGEGTIWSIIATLMLGLGLGSLISGLRLKKRYE
jgi:hypothetical protein